VLIPIHRLGKGAFFKAHKDTPRGEQMFGSLVLVLPAEHKGGELVLRSKKDEFVFDAASILSDRLNHIAYVAFYSDVDHEVREVLEGHRVTITYNLYWDKTDASDQCNLNNAFPMEESRQTPLVATLTSLLGRDFPSKRRYARLRSPASLPSH
jgi:hypothetical protein